MLARANEFEADRESARVTSREDAGDALAAVYARSDYIETRFWGEFYARAQTQAEPPHSRFSDYVAALRSIPAQHSACALASALARETGLNDTHPSLKDRLAALDVRPNIPLSFQLSAAHALLQEQAPAVDGRVQRGVARVDRRDIGKSVTNSCARPTTSSAATKPSRPPASSATEEQWDYACARGNAEGRPRCAAGARCACSSARRRMRPPAMHAGAFFCEDDEERGVADVERAMQLDESAREPGSQLLYSFFYARNQLAAATSTATSCRWSRESVSSPAEERRCLKRRESAAAASAGRRRARGLDGCIVRAAGPQARLARAAPREALCRRCPPMCWSSISARCSWIGDATFEAVAKSLPAD